MSAVPRPARVVARANIALIKYWGKADAAVNRPAVGSLSLTLSGLETETRVAPAGGGPRFALDGEPMDSGAAGRIRALAERLGLTDLDGLDFASENRFPTAAGLASSASGGAAAVLALDTAYGLELPRERIVAEALQVSGSAPRSLFGGFVRLDPDPDQGCRVRSLVMPAGWDVRVLVAQTAAGPKETSSRTAMERSKESAYYDAWVGTHRADLDAAEAALEAADWPSLLAAMERSTLKMHALPMTSEPPVWYWRPTTLAVLEAVRAGRAEGLEGGFTMDAGPHVKLFCQGNQADAWAERLAAVPGVLGVIRCGVGEGPTVERDGEAVAW